MYCEDITIKNKTFILILFSGFLLEFSSYLSFPYISLQLRDRFHFIEKEIGFLFICAIWLRPLWALLGSFLMTKLSSRILVSFACILESVSFLFLGTSHDPFWACFAIIVINMGLSIWNPCFYSYVYQIFNNKNDTKQKVSILNTFLYTGASVGCFLGSFLVIKSITLVFIIAAVLFFITAITLIINLKNVKLDNKVNHDKMLTNLQRIDKRLLILIILLSISFWGSYNQFNSFFTLYANDWLQKTQIAGLAFGAVTIIVALVSFLISRFAFIVINLKKIMLIFLIIYGLAWFIKVEFPSIYAAILFVFAISVLEACFVLFFAEKWAELGAGNHQIAQSLNYSFSNIGMGLGSFIGGLFYCTPSVSCFKMHYYGTENILLVGIALLVLFFIPWEKNKL